MISAFEWKKDLAVLLLVFRVILISFEGTGADRFEAPSGCSLAESVEYLRKQSAEMKFDIDTIKKQAEEILEVPSHTRMLSAPLVSQCH